VSEIKRELNNFYIYGGFPEIVKNEDLSLLEQYFKDILYRDIIVRHGIKNNKEVRELALILSSEIATNQSYQKLKTVLNIKSLTSIKQYIGYFSESYLFFQLGLFSNSLKQQIYNSKKNYCIDIALANSVSFVTSRNEGRLYENIVFLELIRRNEEIYYWKSSSDKEVDFILKKGTQLLTAIQVSIDISNDATKEREFSALLCAHRELGIDDLIVLTKDDEYDIIYHDTNISIKPIWKYLLNQ
jgi:predicted AAA+ superfamily ATPase